MLPGGRRKELSPCGCSHALCFPLVLTGSFSSKREKGGRNRILWARTETHRASSLCCAGLQWMSPFWPGAPEPQQADLHTSGGLLRSRQRARGRGPGPAHLHVGAARPGGLSLRCPLLLPRQGPSPLSQTQAPPSTSGTEPQRSPDVPSCDLRAPGSSSEGSARGSSPLCSGRGWGTRRKGRCLWAAWPADLFLNPVRCHPICRLR